MHRQVRKIVLLFGAVMLLAGNFAQYAASGPVSPSESARFGGKFRVALISDPAPLDIQFNTAQANRVVQFHVVETLFALDADFKPVPHLLKSWSVSDDGKTYTFDLREGVRFHNGQELTADDVVASLQRWTKVRALAATTFSRMTSMRAVGKYRVVLQLAAPAPAIPYVLASQGYMGAIYPKQQVEAAGTTPIRMPIGTGPYKIVDYVVNSHTRLARFDDYSARDDKPSGHAGRRVAYFDEIDMITVPDAAVRLSGAEAGNYDLALLVSADSYANVLNNANVKSHVVMPRNTVFLALNIRRALFRDRRVREAFAAALDKPTLMKAAFGHESFWRASPSLVPKGSPWYSEIGMDRYKLNDPRRARALLDEAGYQGRKVPITWILTRDFEYMYRMAIAVQPMLEAAGFQVTLDITDNASVLRRWGEATWDVQVTGALLQFDPIVLDWLLITKSNPWGFSNGVIDDYYRRLLTQARSSTGRKELWDKIQQLTWDELPIVVLGTGGGLNVVTSRVEGYQTNNPYEVLWNVWFKK